MLQARAGAGERHAVTLDVALEKRANARRSLDKMLASGRHDATVLAKLGALIGWTPATVVLALPAAPHAPAALPLQAPRCAATELAPANDAPQRATSAPPVDAPEPLPPSGPRAPPVPRAAPVPQSRIAAQPTAPPTRKPLAPLFESKKRPASLPKKAKPAPPPKRKKADGKKADLTPGQMTLDDAYKRGKKRKETAQASDGPPPPPPSSDPDAMNDD